MQRVNSEPPSCPSISHSQSIFQAHMKKEEEEENYGIFMFPQHTFLLNRQPSIYTV